jgi:transcriptional regulator with XRE-family HTH domain
LKLPRLKEVRELHGWSQAKLAEESDVSRDSISNYETGQREAWPATAKKLADALHVEIADLREPVRELATSGKADAPMEAGLAGADPSSRLIYADVLEKIAGLWAEELARGLYDRRTLGLKHMVGGIVAMNHEAAVREDRQNFPPHFLEQLEAAEERFVAVEIQIWEAIEAADSEQAAPPDELAARREAREAKREELRQQLRGSKQARHA